MKRITIAFIIFHSLIFAVLPAQIFAHGGEDHAEDKPKTAMTDTGTVSHFSRLGNLEVLLKHPAFEPDTATSARLFVTKFESNEGFGEVTATVEFEAANGSVVQATIEKDATTGIFSVRIPPLPEGNYKIRVNLAHGGETDTATFSGIEVSGHSETAVTTNEMSWARTILIGALFTIVILLFGALIYFVLKLNEDEMPGDEIVSA